MKTVCVVSPTFNEQDNVYDVYMAVKEEFSKLPGYEYEHLFIDDDSTDNTQTVLREIALKDEHVKLIFNAKNFGHIVSPYYGLLQSNADITILFAGDMQDPAEAISRLIKKWEEGFLIVAGQKTRSEESKVMYLIRTFFYFLINKFSETHLISNYTGFGLYDKSIIDLLKKYPDPYPYFRGLVCELGHKITTIEYLQRKRKKGKSKNNFYTLYDVAILGFTMHSKLLFRLAVFSSIFFLPVLILIIIFTQINLLQVFIALLLIFNLFFIGIIGEYIFNIQLRSLKRPLVIEKERVNFK